MKLFFDDEAFDGQLQRSVGKAEAGMASVGECLAIASTITPGDRRSWHDAWSAFATDLADRAATALGAGRRATARELALRACEYHRQAGFFHRDDLDGPELRDSYRASVAAFAVALPLLPHPAVRLEPDAFAEPASGYLFTPPGDGPFPTLVHLGGYDSTAEELYAAATPVLARGFALAALDGPGQGEVLYERRVPMRPDWEHVVPGLVDALVARPEVDPDRLVLVGRSFGGVLAPRGAAGEPRLAAMVVDPGQFDLGAAFRSRLGDLLDHVDDPAATEQFESLLTIPALAALFRPRMVTHGVTTVQAYCREALRFTNAETAGRVTCPSFVTDNETDPISTGQGRILADHLTCPATFRLFTRAEGAEGHCEGMAPGVFWAAALDWLDDQLAAR